MAVSFQSSTTATANGTTVSVSFDVGTGSDRVLYADHSAAGTVTGATYNSVSMSNIKLQGNLDVFELVAPATGSNTLSVTNGSYVRQYLCAGAFNGVDQTTPSGTPTGATSSGATKSTPSTTCPTDGMVYGAMRHGYTSGSAAAITGAGNTLASSYRYSGTGQGIAGGYRSATGQVSWTTSSSTAYDTVGVPINAASGGGAYTLVCDSGTYAVTGTAVGLIKDSTLAADSGSYTYSGTALDLIKGVALTADSGTYIYTGTIVNLVGSGSLVMGSGTYVYTGTNTTLEYNAIMAADSGTYAYTGTAVDLTHGNSIQLDSGSYVVTGTDIAFNVASVITLDSGTYSYTGNSVSLVFSGGTWTIQPDSTTTWTAQSDSNATWTIQ